MKHHFQTRKCYGNPIIENIADTDYKYAKKVPEDFLIQNPGKYRDLYAQNDTLLLADLFESFLNKCIELQELGNISSKHLTGSGLHPNR